MDIKSKKSTKFKCAVSWICFFLSVSLFTGTVLFALTTNYRVIPDAFQSDIQQTGTFRQIIGGDFDSITTVLNSNQKLDNCLTDDSKNMVFYANKSNKTVTNTTYNLANGDLPKGFNYLLAFDGEKLTITKDGKNIDVYQQQNLWAKVSTSLPGFDGYQNVNWKNCTVYIAVNSTLTENYSCYSPLYHAMKYYEMTRFQVYAMCVMILLSILLFVSYILWRKSKALVDQKIASVTGKVWFEIKLVILVADIALFLNPDLACYLFNMLCHPFGINISSYSVPQVWTPLLFFGISLWYGYLIINDIRYNKKFYQHNLINYLIAIYRKQELKRPIQRQMFTRILVLFGIEIVLLLIGIFIINDAAHDYSYCGFPRKYVFALICVLGLMVYAFYRFLRRFKNTANDMCLLIDQIDRVKSGDLSTPLTLPKDADIHHAAQSLNTIQSGLHNAVEEQVKSERMKVELITNVSHDIKTPLTSIIGYIDLLQQEPDLPEHIQDYIKILANKSDRMKNMVQDVFEVSKATTGNIDLNLEILDFAKLINQTLADMDEEITTSQLTFKVDIPNEAVPIQADGKRLYRVFQNLIKNALQYSLEGSRVFVSLRVTDGKALAEVKNTSCSEISADFNYAERFVRGDQARTTEGSGLGLSIAKSFTEACDGKFRISTIADLFCAEVEFSVTVPEEITQGTDISNEV